MTVLKSMEQTQRFAQLVEQSELAHFVSTTPDLTIFAPNNKAIADLPPYLHTYYFSDNPQSREKLKNQVKYNITPVLLMAKDLRKGKIPTAHGSKAYIQLSAQGVVFIDRAQLLELDIQASNGVIHIIDSFNLSNLWK